MPQNRKEAPFACLLGVGYICLDCSLSLCFSWWRSKDWNVSPNKVFASKRTVCGSSLFSCVLVVALQELLGKSCRIIIQNIHYCCCQLAEHTANLTPAAKPTCLAQSRKDKVIFPLWNQIQGMGCCGLVTAEQHTANSKHNSQPHLPSLISQAACLCG